MLQKILGVIIIMGAVSGCELEPTPPPESPTRNVWSVDDPYRFVTAAPVAVVLVRCISCNEYAHRHQDQSNKTWYLAEFNVEQVESGVWSDKRVVFVCVNLLPEFDSDTRFRLRPWPYQPGKEFRFWLDTTHSPATLIGQQLLWADAQH